jgi:phenylalanyl-tRNA synthetase alpha chain
VDHQAVVGALKSLEATKFLSIEQKTQQAWQLTPEGQEYATGGTLEFRIYQDVPADDGVLKTVLEDKYGKNFSIGFSYCMKRKWLIFNKDSGKVTRAAQKVEDEHGLKLKLLQSGKELPETDHTELASRKLVEKKVFVYFLASKGPNFSLEIREEFADISAEMLKRRDFESLYFKPFNQDSLGKEITCGALHPLLKVRSTFREILLELGFEEMPTNNFVENSFWNFDSLFVPQQHPARDQQDTFFLKEPSHSQLHNQAYSERVKEMHEVGGHGSIGWRYNYSVQESQRNIFRTHTTCVSSKMLAKMAEEGFRDAKYFSIDRVFRNETLDATHLAEFHQIEGLVCGKDLGLQHLMGIIKEFFRKIGTSCVT